MTDITFKPKAANIIRYNLIGSLISVPVGMGLVMPFIARSSTVLSWKDISLLWLAASSAGILGGLFGQFLVLKKSLETFSITISDRNVIGPKPWAWKRRSLEIGKLDKARSNHRSLFQRLFGLRILRFRDGEKLEICAAYYGKEQIETLLEVLQLEN